MPVCRGALAQALEGLARPRHVALVGNDHLGTLGKLGRIGLKLMVNGLVVLDGVSALVAAREIHDVHDESRTLDVAKELVPQALALARALDEAGDVGDDEGAGLPGANDAEVGHERREGIVGDLGARRAHARDERGLAHARHAHEGGICHELHLELDPVLEGRLALLREGGRSANRGDEVDVALTARAAGTHDDTLAGMREVRDLIPGGHGLGGELGHNRAARNLENEVLAVTAVLTRSLAMGASLSAEVVLEAIVDERGELRVALENDVAASATVAAVRAALGYESLAPERRATGTAVAALDVDA